MNTTPSGTEGNTGSSNGGASSASGAVGSTVSSIGGKSGTDGATPASTPSNTPASTPSSATSSIGKETPLSQADQAALTSAAASSGQLVTTQTEQDAIDADLARRGLPPREQKPDTRTP